MEKIDVVVVDGDEIAVVQNETAGSMQLNVHVALGGEEQEQQTPKKKRKKTGQECS